MSTTQYKNLGWQWKKKLNGDIKLSIIHRACFKGNTCSMLYMYCQLDCYLAYGISDAGKSWIISKHCLWYQQHNTLSLVSRNRRVGVFATSSKRKKPQNRPAFWKLMNTTTEERDWKAARSISWLCPFTKSKPRKKILNNFPCLSLIQRTLVYFCYFQNNFCWVTHMPKKHRNPTIWKYMNGGFKTQRSLNNIRRLHAM